mmetsp:Transcript_21445/g.60481  ORF Transcript_21445/g.60481 Transcript_21445/m.60481 type:complete len:306 (+) Transcript_21445:1877-2794(+)
MSASFVDSSRCAQAASSKQLRSFSLLAASVRQASAASNASHGSVVVSDATTSTNCAALRPAGSRSAVLSNWSRSDDAGNLPNWIAPSTARAQTTSRQLSRSASLSSAASTQDAALTTRRACCKARSWLPLAKALSNSSRRAAADAATAAAPDVVSATSRAPRTTTSFSAASFSPKKISRSSNTSASSSSSRSFSAPNSVHTWPVNATEDAFAATCAARASSLASATSWIASSTTFPSRPPTMDSSATPLQDLRVVVMDLAASLHSLLLPFAPSKLEKPPSKEGVPRFLQKSATTRNTASAANDAS